MTLEITTAAPIRETRDRRSQVNVVLAGGLAALRTLLHLARPSRSIRDLSDRDLADLHLHRWDVEDPDPRAPRLF